MVPTICGSPIRTQNAFLIETVTQGLASWQQEVQVSAPPLPIHSLLVPVGKQRNTVQELGSLASVWYSPGYAIIWEVNQHWKISLFPLFSCLSLFQTSKIFYKKELKAKERKKGRIQKNVPPKSQYSYNIIWLYKRKKATTYKKIILCIQLYDMYIRNIF